MCTSAPSTIKLKQNVKKINKYYLPLKRLNKQNVDITVSKAMIVESGSFPNRSPSLYIAHDSIPAATVDPSSVTSLIIQKLMRYVVSCDLKSLPEIKYKCK